MSKSNQMTLFQSWGYENGPPSSSSDRSRFCAKDNHNNEFNSDDDDYMLVQIMDESLRDYQESFKKTEPFNTPDNQTQSCGVQVPTENIKGFDVSAGQTWIYPTNYPIRDYQYNIVRQVLFTNTLVALPTGLGKTFIAAVVMYNFYRWFPTGKIVFMAPTRPLVSQQIEACFNIMGIPQEDTVEMTGTMKPSERQKLWNHKRVFFLTPQIMSNDLVRAAFPAEQLKCLVVDEAHKASGNYAYCMVVRELLKITNQFRVLALSATPGSDIKAVQEVINNLLIAKIELRTEDSSDIIQYSYERKVEKIVIQLNDEIKNLKNKYMQIILVVVNRLTHRGVLPCLNLDSLSKFALLKLREKFRQNPPSDLSKAVYGSIEGDFALCMTLYHGYELLMLHGAYSLYNFLKGIVDKDKGSFKARAELMRNYHFTELMEELKCKADRATSENLNHSLESADFGHPKLIKLKEIVVEHFTRYKKDNAETKTRIMIFSQYRDSVQQITNVLKHCDPLVRVISFIGHASGNSVKGFTQKEQLKIVKQFREGDYNTLVSTCVGEEGLDIGDIDLIICFDSPKSPVRLIQRMGRTGRKREGRIVVLVTEGKEERMYMTSQCIKKNIDKAILNPVQLQLYKYNPRMIPIGLTPKAIKMYISVGKFQSNLKQKSIHRLLSGKHNKKFRDSFLTNEELSIWNSKFKISLEDIPSMPKSKFLSIKNPSDQGEEPNIKCLSLCAWIPWQNRLQRHNLVSHSLKTKHFIELMQLIEIYNQMDPKVDSFDADMTYLVEDDIIKPGEKNTSKSLDGVERYGISIPNASCERKHLFSHYSSRMAKFNKKLKTAEKKKTAMVISDNNENQQNRLISNEKSPELFNDNINIRQKTNQNCFHNDDNDFVSLPQRENLINNVEIVSNDPELINKENILEEKEFFRNISSQKKFISQSRNDFLNIQEPPELDQEWLQKQKLSPIDILEIIDVENEKAKNSECMDLMEMQENSELLSYKKCSVTLDTIQLNFKVDFHRAFDTLLKDEELHPEKPPTSQSILQKKTISYENLTDNNVDKYQESTPKLLVLEHSSSIDQAREEVDNRFLPNIVEINSTLNNNKFKEELLNKKDHSAISFQDCKSIPLQNVPIDKPLSDKSCSLSTDNKKSVIFLCNESVMTSEHLPKCVNKKSELSNGKILPDLMNNRYFVPPSCNSLVKIEMKTASRVDEKLHVDSAIPYQSISDLKTPKKKQTLNNDSMCVSPITLSQALNLVSESPISNYSINKTSESPINDVFQHSSQNDHICTPVNEEKLDFDLMLDIDDWGDDDIIPPSPPSTFTNSKLIGWNNVKIGIAFCNKNISNNVDQIEKTFEPLDNLLPSDTTRDHCLVSTRILNESFEKSSNSTLCIQSLKKGKDTSPMISELCLSPDESNKLNEDNSPFTRKNVEKVAVTTPDSDNSGIFNKSEFGFRTPNSLVQHPVSRSSINQHMDLDFKGLPDKLIDDDSPMIRKKIKKLTALSDNDCSELTTKLETDLKASNPTFSQLKASSLSSEQDSDLDFQESSINRKRKKILLKKMCKKKKKRHPFIDDEVEVSFEDGNEVSSDEEESDLDHLEESFICEDSQAFQSSSSPHRPDMKALYLQSVRSPIFSKNLKLGMFHRPVENIFSQPATESCYLEDSFCVNNEFVEYESDQTEEQFQARFKSKLLTPNKKLKARRRIITHDSSESEDDANNEIKVPFKNSSSFTNLSANPSLLDNKPQLYNSLSRSEEIVTKTFSHIQDVCHLLNSDLTEFHNTQKEILRQNRLKRQRAKQDEFRQKFRSPNKAQINQHNSTSLNDVQPLTILVNGKELSGSQQIISDLRLKHKINVVIYSALNCDYIVSNRIGVERRIYSDFLNIKNRKKLIDRIQGLFEVFPRPCLIIEKDRLKPNEVAKSRNKYVDCITAELAQTHLLLLYSNNQEETAAILTMLAENERSKSMAISVPVELSNEKEQAFRFFQSLPKISSINALNLCHHYHQLQDFFKSSPDEIKEKGKMSQVQVDEIVKYLKHSYSVEMTSQQNFNFQNY